MDIIQNFSTTDILFDKPLKVFNMNLYSCKTKDYERFSKLSSYIIYSPKHFNIQKSSDLLFFVIYNHMVVKNKGNEEGLRKNTKKQDKLLNECMTEICELISYVTRDEVSYTIIEEKGKQVEYRFIIGKEPTGNVEKDPRPYINNNNFDLIRKLLLKMNMLNEPKIYENSAKGKCLEQIERRSISAKGKLNNVNLGEIVNLISCSTGKEYSTISEQNIIQTYSDFHRCVNSFNSISTSIFKSVDNKYKGSSYPTPVIDDLFINPYDTIWGKAGKMLGGLV